MTDESMASSLLELPDRKTTLEWGFRSLMVAAYFWSVSHFVSLERYEKDSEKQDAQRSILINQLESVNITLGHIDERMKNDQRRDDSIKDLEQRVRQLEYGTPSHHP